MPAMIIGVTTPRAPECKRGLAVNLAASVSRNSGARVCVVDGDPLTRDVSTRLPVRGAMLEDYATAAMPSVDRIGLLPTPEIAVLGSCADGLGRARLAAERATPVLRAHFDLVVWDLLAGPTGPGRIVGARLEILDWLLLAVTPEQRSVRAAAHFLEHFETARSRGAIDERLRFGIVCTGDEGCVAMSPEEVEAELGTPIVGAVPQLWGRSEPNLGFGPALAIPELDDAVDALVARLYEEPKVPTQSA
ncbi:MAG: hypothetical protein SGJ13_02090 [Actinomycetota bacterium]|nr:hypothetical protein [Actinomycetota bacterium]